MDDNLKKCISEFFKSILFTLHLKRQPVKCKGQIDTAIDWLLARGCELKCVEWNWIAILPNRDIVSVEAAFLYFMCEDLKKVGGEA